MMNVGIVGLGLIGGSMAKAYKKASWQVWGADINKSVLEQAKNEQAIDGVLDDEKIKKVRAYFDCALSGGGTGISAGKGGAI